MSEAMISPFPANESRFSPVVPAAGETAGSPSGAHLRTGESPRAAHGGNIYITIARLPLDLAGPQADERRGWRLLRRLRWALRRR